MEFGPGIAIKIDPSKTTKRYARTAVSQNHRRNIVDSFKQDSEVPRSPK